MTPSPILPDELAARLTARLCHDVASHASILTSGLDLMAMAQGQTERMEAAELLNAGLAGLEARLGFYRQVFGRGETVEAAGDLEARARALFADVRPELVWAVTARALAGPIARAMINLVQIASEVLAAGGSARVESDVDGHRVKVTAAGSRARLNPESRAGLRGEPPGAGPGGRWIQAYILHAQLAAVGGTLAIAETEGEVAFEARLPGRA